MSFSYLASFDIADPRNDFGTVRFVRSGGAEFTLDIVADVANGPVVSGSTRTTIYNHYTTGIGHFVAEDSESSTGLEYVAASQSWGQLFQERMRQAASAAGWSSPNTLTVSFDMDTHVYTFGYVGNFNTIQFSTTAGRQLFGFSGNFSGSSNSVSSTLTPSFCIVPTLSAVTTNDVEGVNYEMPGISMQAVSEYGSVFGLTRTCSPLCRDWTQQSETKAKTIRLSAANAHPFTHQTLFEKGRSIHPFVVIDGFGDGKDYVFKLRPDACTWSSKACKRAGGELDDVSFDISYEAQVLGVLEADVELFSGQLVINGFDVVINEDNNATVNA